MDFNTYLVAEYLAPQIKSLLETKANSAVLLQVQFFTLLSLLIQDAQFPSSCCYLL